MYCTPAAFAVISGTLKVAISLVRGNVGVTNDLCLPLGRQNFQRNFLENFVESVVRHQLQAEDAGCGVLETWPSEAESVVEDFDGFVRPDRVVPEILWNQVQRKAASLDKNLRPQIFALFRRRNWTGKNGDAKNFKKVKNFKIKYETNWVFIYFRRKKAHIFKILKLTNAFFCTGRETNPKLFSSIYL